MVNRVEAFKKKVALEKYSVKTKTPKITDFIAKQKSRQEFLPLLGNFIDKAHVEPLHLKNNAWQFLRRLSENQNCHLIAKKFQRSHLIVVLLK